MNCEYCGEADCHAAKLSGERMISIIRACRDRTRDRALRAEAEVAAFCGRPEELTPHLPDGWAWDATCCEWHGPGGLYLTESGCLGRDKPGAFCPERRSDGLLAVMADAVADVVAAEGDR